METPSLVIVGAPHFFSSTTLRPLGPSVTRTASASWFIPLSSARRAFSSKAISLGICCLVPSVGPTTLALSLCRVLTVNRLGELVQPRPRNPGEGLPLSPRRPPARSRAWRRLAPACRSPSRNRMSSSATKTLTKRRSLPAVVEEPLAEPGVGGVERLEDLADGRAVGADLAAAPRERAELGGYADVDGHGQRTSASSATAANAVRVGAMVAVGRHTGATASSGLQPVAGHVGDDPLVGANDARGGQLGQAWRW